MATSDTAPHSDAPAANAGGADQIAAAPTTDHSSGHQPGTAHDVDHSDTGPHIGQDGGDHDGHGHIGLHTGEDQGSHDHQSDMGLHIGQDQGDHAHHGDMGLHIGQDQGGHDHPGDVGLHIGQDQDGYGTHNDMGPHPGQAHSGFSDGAQPYQDLVAQSQTTDHHDGSHAGAATSFEHAHDFTNVGGEHHGDVATPTPASEYLALAQSHDGDAGQAVHGAGHDQRAPEYTQLAGGITPPIDHQQPIAPDQLLAETGGAHGAPDASHDQQPAPHDDAAAAHVPAMEMPVETDHGHHG